MMQFIVKSKVGLLKDSMISRKFEDYPWIQTYPRIIPGYPTLISYNELINRARLLELSK
jgi:hypothetical protein